MTHTSIAIINGPNLNLVGSREPGIYGEVHLDVFLEELKQLHPDLDIQVMQSNLEGQLIDWIQQANTDNRAIILNPGGYAHTSVAILDAIRSCKVPVIEVHITNVHAREPFRHTLLTAAAAKGVISGFGLEVYQMALIYLTRS